MKSAFSAILLLAISAPCNADDWVCPDPKDEFCDSYHAEYIAEQADKRLKKVYQKLLSDYPEKKEMEFTKIAQRAWLKYSDAHCAAILNKFVGAPFTMAEMEYTCRTDQINKRIKELESYCGSCNLTNPTLNEGGAKMSPLALR